MIRQAVRTLRARLKAFSTDAGGAIAIVWALSSLVVIAMVGSAIDYSRAVNTKEIIAQQLDGAMLAGARFLSSSTDIAATKAQIRAVFNDTSAATLDKKINYEVRNIQISPEKGTITATGYGEVKTAFMQILGIRTMPVSVQSQVNYNDKYLELAVVLDLTGSMDQDDGTGQTKINALRTAATALVNTLMPDTGTVNDRVRIALIPYSQGVRLDTSLARKATNDYSTKCATERTGAEAYTDASYTAEPIGNGSGISESNAETASQSAGSCPQSKVMPLTSNRGALLSAIDNLNTRGGTAGHTGIAWGWYALSPTWSDLWPTDSEPAAYAQEDTLKYVIIMSDGEFNRYYKKKTVSSGHEGCRLRFDWNSGLYWDCPNGSNSTDYWYEVKDNSYEVPSQRALSLCDAMKKTPANQDQGINIYTVFLSPDTGTRAEQTLKSCASGDDKFTQATNGQALTNTFVRYAKEIQQLYLSK